MNVPTTISLECNSRSGNAKYNYPSNYIRTTKYTLLNFVYKNLMEQFKKMSNVFFLLNMVIALIPGVSPVFPATTIMPLVIVLGVAAARDAYENYQCYLSDKKANALEVKIVDSSGKIVSIESHQVSVGDVLYLERGQEIPVDCLVLSTALADGACFVETSNLDGETNLKPKQSKRQFHERFSSPSTIPSFSGTISCDSPNNSLHKWQGKISVPNMSEQSVDIDSFLLRGCQVRNVDWVMAVTVYTGVNTKLFLNLTQKPPKASRLDTKLNRLILMILGVQQLIILAICGCHLGFRDSLEGAGFYIRHIRDEDSGFIAFVMMYMTYFILLSLMMPISLFVSLEFCKTAQAKLMEWDEQMKNKRGDSCRARTSSLNEELSQVQYVFSDKTGTLTENQMRFAEAFAGGISFNELKKPGEMQTILKREKDSAVAIGIGKFLRLLALCNTAVINTNPDGSLAYDGSSTDEIALCDCAASNGEKLLSRTSDSMTISHQGQRMSVDIADFLPFTPERKMMSVIIKEKDGTFRLYTKGADSSVMARLAKSTNPTDIRNAQAFLNKCAESGLRTLACGERILSSTEYLKWKAVWEEACLTVTADRPEKVHKAALLAEENLSFIGCTAIEDRLQDEVPETIHFLLRCSIIVWVLTGDKRETAINIAGTSRLLDARKDLIVQLDMERSLSVGDQIEEAIEKVKEAAAAGKKSSFVLDGKTMEIVFASHMDAFRQLGQLVNSAVCCRVTPLQKASIVAMFQGLGHTCLAVGDGANDVSMIQEAKVGIGILGLEGSQAERASDYAIPRFKHLRRLLAVHGRYSLVRNSMLIQYSFYKNIVYSLCHCYYACYNAFTGQTIFDSWVIIFFNMAFTFFPPLVMGIIEYDIRDTFLLKHPGLYGELRSAFAVRMSRVTSSMWFLLSIFHSWVIFYGTYGTTMQYDNLAEGRTAGMWVNGTTMMNLLLTVVIAQSAICFLSWTWFHVLSIVLSFLSYYAFIFLYESLPISWGMQSYYKVASESMSFNNSWFTMFLWVTAIFGPQMIILVSRRRFFATDQHAARFNYHTQKKLLQWELVQELEQPLNAQEESESTDEEL